MAFSGSLALGGAALAADNPPSKSAALAKELAQQLDQAKLEHIAARDPEDPTRFVAAMYFPGLQLITVAGKYGAPVLLNEKLLNHNYKDAYIDLSSASDRATRVTVNDLRADGLPTAKLKDAPPDSIDQGSTDFVFDFDWKKAKLSQDDYNKKVVESDALYAKMLTILLSEIKKVAPAPTK